MPYERKTIDISVSEDLREILKEIEGESIVASLLLKRRHNKEDLVESYVDFISISSQDRGKISYLTNDRMESVDANEYWTSSRRYHTKPGSFITKLFTGVSAKEIEKFSGLFRSQSQKTKFVFKIVNGKEIKRYYSENSYAHMRASLGASCMKHDHCQNYFQLYTKNEDKVSMLVMLNPEGNLLGRAILWNFESVKLMDRIYTTNDEDLQFHFKKWATENDYLYKSDQNWSSSLYFEQLGQKKRELRFDIKLDNIKLDRYPYMDTFKFLDTNKGILSNYLPDNMDYVRTLTGSDGNTHYNDYLRLDDIDRVFRHRGDTVYVDYLKLYTTRDNCQYSDINNQYILRKDSEYKEEVNDYIFNEEFNHLNSPRLLELIEKYSQRKQEKYSDVMSSIDSITAAFDSSMFTLGQQGNGVSSIRLRHPADAVNDDVEVSNIDFRDYLRRGLRLSVEEPVAPQIRDVIDVIGNEQVEPRIFEGDDQPF